MPIAKALCFFVFILLSQGAKANKVTLMVEDYPPYIEKEAKPHGFMTALVAEAFNRMNIRSEVKFGSWWEVETALEDKRVISFMWQLNKERNKKWYFSDPIYVQNLKFVATKDFNTDIHQLHSLRNLKLGLIDGLDYGKKIEGFRHKLSIEPQSSDFAALGALLEGRLKLIVMEPAAAVYLAKKYYGDKAKGKLKFIDTPHFDPVPFYLVCSKNYGNCLGYIKKFNKGLAQLEGDGTRASLIQSAETL